MDGNSSEAAAVVQLGGRDYSGNEGISPSLFAETSAFQAPGATGLAQHPEQRVPANGTVGPISFSLNSLTTTPNMKIQLLAPLLRPRARETMPETMPILDLDEIWKMLASRPLCDRHRLATRILLGVSLGRSYRVTRYFKLTGKVTTLTG